MTVKGYKVFNPDWTCNNFQYEVGKTYEMDSAPECCNRGFHFCTKLVDCFSYYSFDPNNKVAEVEALGDIDANSVDSKYCTNKIHIIREIPWNEVLGLVNTGENCIGFGNSGDDNRGNLNSGDLNNGSGNTGSYNRGDHNSGYYNSGSCNSGYCNSGSQNNGDYNRGNRNNGNRNKGNFNNGYFNKGTGNNGDFNNGDYNRGDWNVTSFSNGCFNTEAQKIFFFNKPSDWTLSDWSKSEARDIMSTCPQDCITWIWLQHMTEKEKTNHPEAEITGGYLRLVYAESERQVWWDNLSNRGKDVIMSIPNFDKEIFKEITGIDIYEK